MERMFDVGSGWDAPLYGGIAILVILGLLIFASGGNDGRK